MLFNRNGLSGIERKGISVMAEYVLKLYVSGQSALAQQTIANIKSICENELEGHCQLEVFNIMENPQLAEDDGVIATPTLVKVSPEPSHRVVGDLSVTSKVLAALDIVAQKRTAK